MQQDHLKARYLDETYENMSMLKENTFVVRHRQTKKIYVKKYVAKELLPIYLRVQKICDHRIEKIYTCAEDTDRSIVITEYISGTTLQEYIEDHGPLPERRACAIIEDLLQILQKIHREGIIHRDITPSNVMLTNEGVTKLIDFNIARQKKRAQGTDTTILGTAGYAAPEQYGFSQTDERTDIYSIGVLWNVLLTGCLPSEKRYTRAPLSQIIQRCTEMDSRQRYQDVQEILDALEIYRLCGSGGRTDTGSEDPPLKPPAGIPGFRTGSLWKYIVASFGYCMMILYSIYSISECSSTWRSLILETAAVLLYVWIAPLIAANVGYLDRKIALFKNIPTPVKVTIRILLCITFFIIGAFLEVYVRDTLLGIAR